MSIAANLIQIPPIAGRPELARLRILRRKDLPSPEPGNRCRPQLAALGMPPSNGSAEELLDWDAHSARQSKPSGPKSPGKKHGTSLWKSVYSDFAQRWFGRSLDGYLRIGAGSDPSVNAAYTSAFDEFSKVYNVYFLAMIGTYLSVLSGMC